MSGLEALAALRRGGRCPSLPIIVLLAEKAPSWGSCCPVVLVKPTDRPADMDFRPLLGLWVAVLMRLPMWSHVEQVIAEMKAVSAKPYGFVTPGGEAHDLTAEPLQERVLNLRRTWEALCNS